MAAQDIEFNRNEDINKQPASQIAFVNTGQKSNVMIAADVTTSNLCSYVQQLQIMKLLWVHNILQVHQSIPMPRFPIDPVIHTEIDSLLVGFWSLQGLLLLLHRNRSRQRRYYHVRKNATTLVAVVVQLPLNRMHKTLKPRIAGCGNAKKIP